MTSVSLIETPGGVLLPVKAQPGGRRNAITGTHDGALKVSVTQAPEKGKANTAIAHVLAELLDLKSKQLQLASGPTSPLKKFLVTNISLAELQQRIDRVLKELGSS
jgi:uncharacterized protein YggU (UPF0235/DUF167 family)